MNLEEANRISSLNEDDGWEHCQKLDKADFAIWIQFKDREFRSKAVQIAVVTMYFKGYELTCVEDVWGDGGPDDPLAQIFHGVFFYYKGKEGSYA